MAKEEKIKDIAVVEETVVEDHAAVQEVTRTFKVLVNFTYDKAYRKGNTVELSSEAVIQKLLTKKFIK